MMTQSADLDAALEEMNHSKETFFRNHEERMKLLEKALNKSTEQIKRNAEEMKRRNEKDMEQMTEIRRMLNML
jgi:hypothetical protein